MRNRNRLTAGLVCAVMTAVLIIPASAHGHHGRRVQTVQPAPSVQTTITVCPYEDCTIAGRHVHDGVTYCGYNHASGYCDGACRALCPYEDCTIAGAHTHDGVTYCGYNHADGYCAGGCAAGTVNNGGYGCHGAGHHGCW